MISHFLMDLFIEKKVKVIASRSGVLANMGPGELERKTSENRLDQNAFQYEHLNSLFIKNDRGPLDNIARSQENRFYFAIMYRMILQ